MQFIVILYQLQITLYALVLGLLFGVLYDALRITRMLVGITPVHVQHISWTQQMCIRDRYEGDSVDVLFQLDINEYQNVKNLQFIIKDMRLSEASMQAYENEQSLYRAIRDSAPGLQLTPEEAVSIIPSREDFGVLYNLIKKELRMAVSYTHLGKSWEEAPGKG